MKFLLPIFTLLLLASCDPGITHYTRYENQTPYSLKITSPNIPGDSVIIAPNNITTALETSGIGNANEYSNCPFAVDSVLIECKDTNLTFQGNLNWQFSILKEKFTKSETECRAIIDNSMLR